VRPWRGVDVGEAAGVGHEADVECERRPLGERNARLVEQPGHDLGRARGLRIDEVDVAEERVVVMVIDIDDAREAARGLARAIDPQRGAAIERYQRPLRGIRWNAACNALQAEEGELAGERLVTVLEEHDVAAGRGQRPPEPEQRAERVAVGRGVGADADRSAVAQHLDHLAAAHAPSAGSEPSRGGAASSSGSAAGSGMKSGIGSCSASSCSMRAPLSNDSS
jgi:hypothetical protein